MAFHGLTFPNQNVSSLDDGGLYHGFLGDGIIEGCDVAYTNDSITIQAGWLLVCGRHIQVDGATTINFNNIPTSGYGRIILQIDTSQASTVEEFAQLSIEIDYSNSLDGFSDLVRENINIGSGTIYQFEIAIVQISGGNISSLIRTALHLRILFKDPSGRSGMFGFFTPNLFAYTYDANGQPLAGMRTSDADNAVIFAPDQNILVRPKGSDAQEKQTIFNTSGMMEGGGFFNPMNDVVSRCGNLFMIHAYLSTTNPCPNNVFTTIRTIPNVKFRPNENKYGIAYGFGAVKTMALVQVTPAGEIRVQPWQSTSGTQSWMTMVIWNTPSWTP